MNMHSLVIYPGYVLTPSALCGSFPAWAFVVLSNRTLEAVFLIRTLLNIAIRYSGYDLCLPGRLIIIKHIMSVFIKPAPANLSLLANAVIK